MLIPQGADPTGSSAFQQDVTSECVVQDAPVATLSGAAAGGTTAGADSVGIMTIVAWDTGSTGGGRSLAGGSLATAEKEARGEVNCAGPASKSRESVGAPNRE